MTRTPYYLVVAIVLIAVGLGAVWNAPEAAAELPEVVCDHPTFADRRDVYAAVSAVCYDRATGRRVLVTILD